MLQWSALCAALLCAGAAAADDEAIVTDRPDFVESSSVVGRGVFQFETSVAAERGRRGADGARTRTYSTPTLLRYGVSDTLELRLETDGRLVERGGGNGNSSGYGDVALGVKWHALDEAGGRPSLGFLLHADIDSGSAPFRGHGVRPSLRMAAEWELPDGYALGVMPGVFADRRDDGARYGGAIFGIVLGKSWSERFRSFVELSAPRIAHGRDGGSVLTFDVGGAWLIGQRWQLDTALSRGLNRHTPDLSVTLGISGRY